MNSEDIITEARSWIGTPYQHQGRLKGVGCDCLGLVLGVWEALKGPLPEKVPPYGKDWAQVDARDPLAAAAARHLVPVPPGVIGAGDVLLFRWRPHVAAKHLGIAVDAARMIHAHDDAAVSEVNISKAWMKKLAFRYKFDENVG
jgi:NlpC/P60 family putative phage cell wall peptidase